MQAIYQLDVQGDNLLGHLESFFRENTQDESVASLALKWTKGTWQHIECCDELISKAAIRWKLNRLTQVDRSILRLSVYQLQFCPDIPPKVAINEAIELAKKFSAEQSSAFVNGVLDAVLKYLGAKGSRQQPAASGPAK
jgi:transcription antitermination factor NusB